MFGWGTSDFLAALTSRKIGSFRALFWMSIFTLILISFYFLIFRKELALSGQFFLFLSLVGLLQDAGALSFYKSLEIGKVSLVSPLAGSWAAWTVILSLIFLKEVLSPGQVLGVILIIGGVILVSTKIRQLIKEARLIASDVGVKFAFLSSFFWGTSFVIYKPVIDKFGWLPSALILYGFIVFWLFIYGFTFKKEFLFPEEKTTKGSLASEKQTTKGSLFNFKIEKPTIAFLILLTLTNALAWFAYSLGLENNLASIVSPVASTFPLVTVLLARIFLKEKLVWNQVLGIGGVIAGLVFLSL